MTTQVESSCLSLGITAPMTPLVAARLLGSGGSALTYEVTDANKVHGFLKVLKKGTVEEEVEVLYKLEEMGIHHVPNVLRDFGNAFLMTGISSVDCMSLYLAEESEKLVDYGLQDILLVAVQVLEALVPMAENSIVHRDIKLENIVMCPLSKAVMLIDFGSVSQKGKMTTQYVAPELFLGEKASPASDMWALGVALLLLYSKEMPFHPDSPLLMLQTIGQRLGEKTVQEYVKSKGQSVPEWSYPNSWKSIEQLFESARERFRDTKALRFEKLLRRMLVCDPEKRITAEEALRLAHEILKDIHISIKIHEGSMRLDRKVRSAWKRVFELKEKTPGSHLHIPDYNEKTLYRLTYESGEQLDVLETLLQEDDQIKINKEGHIVCVRNSHSRKTQTASSGT